ncbi:hypothetical protein EDB84DRAFT_1657289 [Lactarius hengduanensis]|nr:hypothetical protein EDB84DRAFT_1657289 [Lactarius hengduanensis]
MITELTKVAELPVVDDGLSLKLSDVETGVVGVEDEVGVDEVDELVIAGEELVELVELVEVVLDVDELFPGKTPGSVVDITKAAPLQYRVPTQAASDDGEATMATAIMRISRSHFLTTISVTGSGISVICFSVIQDIMAVCEAGSAVIAYFYFDFRDLNKQTCRDLLLSLVFQLSTRSSSYCDILHCIYKTHKSGTRQPSDETLKECLKEMLTLPGHGPIFIVLDALDECPDSSGIPSPRDEVLQLVKELVDLDQQQLHICATSRPEVDIRTVLKPLAFHSVSLHDESVRNVVNSSLSLAMRRWRDNILSSRH